jgi:dipeptidase E
MKLFLSSESVSYEQSSAFAKLVGKALNDINVAIIENAADVANGDVPWVDENRISIQTLGCKVFQIDLRDFEGAVRNISLVEVLKPFDVIWIGGGNTYYLRWLLQRTRADLIISDLINQGKVYGGGSAGAIVAGPTTNYFQNADDPGEAEEIILNGLNLTQTVVVPHWGDKDYGPIMKAADLELKKNGYKTVCITNSQALVIDGELQTVVPS